MITYTLPEPADNSPEARALRRRIARDPLTDPAILEKLVSGRHPLDRRTLDALASNPSTPLALLAKLIDRAPAAFCRNPILPMILLEMPDFWSRVSMQGLAVLLRSARAPENLVTRIATSQQMPYGLVEAARMHICDYELTPEDLEDIWQGEIREHWRREIYNMTGQGDYHALCELVEFGVLPGELVRHLPKDDLPPLADYETVHRQQKPQIAKYMDIGFREFPEDITRQRVSLQERAGLLMGAAFASAWSPEQAEDWARRYSDVARTIACNPNAPPEYLKRLARHSDPAIRRLVARNPNRPPAALEISRRYVFLCALGKIANPNQPLDRLSSLVRFLALLYGPEPVRRPLWHTFAISILWEDRLAAAVAIGPRLNGMPMRPRHQDLLKRLANDGNVLVQAAAKARLRGETFSFLDKKGGAP